tara:strand:+ start:138 stop:320 length:183 start_codon:yes stop_codon:yes gene_type:complete
MSTAAKPPSVDLPPLRPQATRGQPAGKPKFVSDRSFFGQKTKKTVNPDSLLHLTLLSEND